VGQLQIGDLNREIFAQMFGMFMTQLYNILPPNTDIRTAFNKGNEQEKNFIQNLAIFFGTFFSVHRKDLEQDRLLKMVIDGHFYLVQLSTVDDIEVFRICLDYWYQLTSDLYHEAPVTSPLMLNSGDSAANTPRRQLYKEVLSKVRDVVISRMAKPEEVIVVEVGKLINSTLMVH
jgi:exportin-1